MYVRSLNGNSSSHHSPLKEESPGSALSLTLFQHRINGSTAKNPGILRPGIECEHSTAVYLHADDIFWFFLSTGADLRSTYFHWIQQYMTLPRETISATRNVCTYNWSILHHRDLTLASFWSSIRWYATLVKMLYFPNFQLGNCKEMGS